MSPFAQLQARQGFSLVEVMIAMSLLAVAMMSLAGAAALGLNQMGRARQDLQYNADVQQVTDSLIGAGWNRVSNGSATIRGRPVNWVVTTVNGNSQKIDIVVQRRGQANATVIYRDTVTVFVSKSQIQ
ncbi:MAG TPA: prepilin-type N-terminal cleavage/methylation domain-containing protein [Gemmatimonadaceae bacterium]|nr:prepilin-type N-terminal cleavage/methylation domain-containing protein [Gemmatimonadaceae bacterium]